MMTEHGVTSNVNDTYIHTICMSTMLTKHVDFISRLTPFNLQCRYPLLPLRVGFENFH